MKKPDAKVDAWGIFPGFRDAFGNWRSVSRRTLQALRQTMGRPGNRAESGAVRIIKQGSSVPLPQPSELLLEDGTVLRVDKAIPSDLPCGYHELRTLKDGRQTRLMVTPGACYLPPALHALGWSLQLYALRSRRSWGLGDLADLRAFGRWAARKQGCDFCLINPLGATIPILPQQTSPYFPSSRSFLNPLYLCIEEVPGAEGLGAPLEKLAQAGRALNARRLIDRDAVFRLKMQALAGIWKRARPDADFERYCVAEGSTLVKFAVYCALAQKFGCGWREWPAEFRAPDSPAVRDYAHEHAEAVGFHQWVQWLLHRQMKSATAEIAVIQDLPIGVDPNGADAWIWQGLLAQGAQVGAPPDAYNAQGQNWGMQPFRPEGLRNSFFEPFRFTIRAALRYGGGLRIDHVMGLFRLFWIPAGKSGQDGAYVQYPVEELLAILAIESHRAKAVVIGEDLGTVEPSMRTLLRQRNVLSYRLLWFESRPVRKFPRKALAAISTHDLFTLAGLWRGADFAEQGQLGMHPKLEDQRKLVRTLCRRLRIGPETDLRDVILKTHELMSRCPSMLLALSLDDVLEVAERPNMPGTVNRANWCFGLPQTLEEISASAWVEKVCGRVRELRRKRRR
jgi:4-alpha-glucanotransferase